MIPGSRQFQCQVSSCSSGSSTEYFNLWFRVLRHVNRWPRVRRQIVLAYSSEVKEQNPTCSGLQKLLRPWRNNLILYLSRIEAYDKQGTHLNAIIQINPRAIEIARDLDEERRTKG